MTWVGRKAALVLAASFVLGGICGGALVYARTLHELRGIVAGPGDPTVRFRLWLLGRALDLSDAQRARVEEIALADVAEEADIRRKIEPELAPIRARRQATIRLFLSPSQQQKFDRLVAESEGARLPARAPR